MSPEKDFNMFIMLWELLAGFLLSLWGILTWRIIKSVPKADLDKSLEAMETRFEKRVDGLKKDLTAARKEDKEDFKEDINKVEQICEKIFDKMEKRKEG
jgi:hypothetical protein